MSVSKIKANGKVVELNQSNYKAAGGEGAIYVKSGYAYKIYHDPAKMIAVGKIKELARIAVPNVLGPLFPITDISDRPIGFGMRYVDKTEYLCKLFNRGFRDANGIDPSAINALVKRMQDTMKHIHEQDILVVDANEMNFLTDRKFVEPYFIDVDCYQTPSYPATAIMESIRDWQVKANKFTENSDWFSLGVVMFQLYMGAHPYKGRHPDHGKDWQAMMKAGVSVFNKATKMPPNAQDWSVIPKGHLKWFERVFEHGERCAPPEPDQVLATAGQVVPTIVDSTDKFVLSLLSTFDGVVEAIRWINGVEYAYTDKSIYAAGRAIQSFSPASGFSARNARHDFVYVQNDRPVKLAYDGINETITWETLDGGQFGKLGAESYFLANDRLYTIVNGNMIEHSFANLGAKVFESQQIVGSVFHSHKTFDGIVVQDILGKCHVSVPVKVGQVNLVKMDCLDGARIIDACHQKGTMIAVAERGGKLERWTIVFDKRFKDFISRREDNASLQDVQLVVLDKGISVATNVEDLELFLGPQKIKVVSDSPFTGAQKLLSFGNDIYLLNGKQLHQVKMK